jgi:hypothetical protein
MATLYLLVADEWRTLEVERQRMADAWMKGISPSRSL